MKYLRLSLILFLWIPVISFGQGSGKCLNMPAALGGQPNIAVVNTFPNLHTNFSITAWVYSTAPTTVGQRIFIDDATDVGGYGLSLSDAGTGKMRFYDRSASSFVLDGSTVFAANTWYHVACVVSFATASTGTVTLYINGVNDGSGSFVAWGGGDPGIASIGGEAVGAAESYKMIGNIDEVIVWNTALTQTNVRDIMCCKQSAANANITAYWNLDAAVTGVNGVPDLKATYPGTISGTLAAGNIVTSGAPLGDASIYLYPGSWAAVTISIGPSPNGQTFYVNNITGATGMQIYEVNAVPSITTGIVGLGNNTNYFGAFVVGAAATTYKANIDYTAYNPWPTEQLFYRADNTANWTASGITVAVSPWIISQAGVTVRREFILGTNSALNPLPVELTYFTAHPQDDIVNLDWQTMSETNNDYFTVERSADGQTVSDVLTKNGAGNSVSVLNYSAIDPHPLAGTSYYRLRQTDFNGQYKTSDWVTVNFNPSSAISFYPNPVDDGHFTIHLVDVVAGDVSVSVFSAVGELVYSSTATASAGTTDINEELPAGIAPGIYLVKVVNAGSSHIERLFVH